MRKEVCLIILINLFLISSVLAYESTITVKTGLPNHQITFKPADPDTGKSIASFTKESNSSGVVVFNYNYDLNNIRIKMSFQAQNNAGNNVNFLNGKPFIFFSNIILDKFVDINLNTQEPTIEVYSGEEKTEEVAEEESEIKEDEEIIEETNQETLENKIIKQPSETATITGAAITKSKEIFLSAKTYYILGGCILLILIIIFAKKKLNKKNGFKVIKLSELQKKKQKNKEKIEQSDDELADAERKLNEAKQELDEIKNRKKRLKEVQARLEKDREELKRLEEE